MGQTPSIQDIINKRSGDPVNPMTEFLRRRSAASSYDAAFQEPITFTGSTGVGESMYDENIPFSQIDNVNEIRARRQPWIAKTGAGVGRVVTKVAAEISKMPGVLGGVAVGTIGQIGDAITGDDNTDFMQVAFNNPWVNAVEDAEEAVKSELLPVYVKKAISEGNLVDNIFSMDFWATEGADGLGYIISMLAPGAAIDKFKLGTKLLSPLANATSKVLGSTEKAAIVLKDIGLTAKNANLWTATAANTLFEAAAEAKGGMDSFKYSEAYQKLLANESSRAGVIFEELVRDYKKNGYTPKDTKLDPEGNPIGMQIPTEEEVMAELRIKANEQAAKEIQDVVGKVGAKIFGANAAILYLPNLMVSKMLWGNPIVKGAASKVKKGTFETLKQLGKKETILYGAKQAAVAGAREGFWEEGMQSTAEQYFTKNPEAGFGDTIGDLVESYTDMISDTPGQKAIFLGAFFGGGMQAYHGTKNEKKSITKTNLLINAANTTLKSLDNLIFSDNFINDKGNIEVDEDGNVTKDYSKVIKKLEGLQTVEDFGAAYDNAVKENDGATIAVIQEVMTTNLIKPFLVNPELGPDALKRYLDESSKLIEQDKTEKFNRDNYIKKIMSKAEKLKGDYEAYSQFGDLFFDIVNKEASQADKTDFYNRTAMEYVNNKSLKYLLKDQIEEINKLIKTVSFPTTVLDENKDTNKAIAPLLQRKKELEELEKGIDEKVLDLWDNTQVNKKFDSDFKVVQARRKLQEQVDGVNKTINDIKNAKDEKELNSVIIPDESISKSALEQQKADRLKEIKEKGKKQGDTKKANAKDKKEEEDLKKVERAEAVEAVKARFNVGEKVSLPKAVTDKMSITTVSDNGSYTYKGINKGNGIILENDKGVEFPINPITMRDSASSTVEATDIDGGTNPGQEDNRDIDGIDPLNGLKTADSTNDARLVVTNNQKGDKNEGLPFISEATQKFERTPKDKKGSYSIKVNDIRKTDNVSSEDSSASEISELEEEIKSINDILTTNTKNTKKGKESVTESVEKAVEKVVDTIVEEENEAAIQAMQDELDALEKALQLNDEGKTEKANKVADEAIAKNLQERKKATAKRFARIQAKKVLNALVNKPSLIVKLKKAGINLSNKLKNLISKINSRVKKLFLGIMLTTALINGTRTQAGNDFLNNYVNKDIANVSQMSIGDILEVGKNSIEKFIKIGAYAETESNIETLFEEPVIQEEVKEEIKEETKVVTAPFLTEPIKIGAPVYTIRANKTVNPVILDLSNGGVQIEFANNMHGKNKSDNKDISDAHGILGATHMPMVPSSNAKKDNHPITLTKNSITNEVKFKLKKDVEATDLVLETNGSNMQPVSNLKIEKDGTGGFNIHTATDPEAGTSVIATRNGGFFHIGLQSGGKTAKPINSKGLTSYRTSRGGMILFGSSDGTVTVLVAGSPNAIFSTLDKLNTKYPDKEFYIVRGDTGSYTSSEMSKDGNVTVKDVNSYSNKGTYGNNQFWVLKKQQEPSTNPIEGAAALNLLLLGYKRKATSGEALSKEEEDELKNKIKENKETIKQLKVKTPSKPASINPDWQRALEMIDANDFSDIDFLANHLPLNVVIAEGSIEIPLETRTKGDTSVFDTTSKVLRETIVKELANGTSMSDITVELVGQWNGDLQLDGNNENNIADLYDFKGDVKNIKTEDIYYVDENGTLVNYQKDIYAGGQSRALAKGEIYIIIKTANGSNFPLKLNVSKIKEKEADLLYDLIKYRFDNRFDDNGNVKEDDTSNVTPIGQIPGVVEKLNNSFPEVIELFNKEGLVAKDMFLKDLLRFFVYDSNTPNFKFRFNNDTFIVGGAVFTKQDFSDNKQGFIDTITSDKVNYKRRNIKTKKAQGDTNNLNLSSRNYMEYLINNSVLNTNAVVNDFTFQGQTTMYISTNTVKVKGKLSNFNVESSKSYNDNLIGNQESLKKMMPGLFSRGELDKIEPEDGKGRSFYKDKTTGEEFDRVSSLKGAVTVDEKMYVASKRGDVIDTLTRLFFSDAKLSKKDFYNSAEETIIDVNERKNRPNTELDFTKEVIDELYDILEEYKDLFNRNDWTVFADTYPISGKIGAKGNIAGAVDLLIYDNKNKKWLIIDLKTSSMDRNDIYNQKSPKWPYKRNDFVQQNAYRELFKQMTGQDTELLILPITLRPALDAPTEYSEIPERTSAKKKFIAVEKESIYKILKISSSTTVKVAPKKVVPTKATPKKVSPVKKAVKDTKEENKSVIKLDRTLFLTQYLNNDYYNISHKGADYIVTGLSLDSTGGIKDGFYVAQAATEFAGVGSPLEDITLALEIIGALIKKGGVSKSFTKENAEKIWKSRNNSVPLQNKVIAEKKPSTKIATVIKKSSGDLIRDSFSALSKDELDRAFNELMILGSEENSGFLMELGQLMAEIDDEKNGKPTNLDKFYKIYDYLIDYGVEKETIEERCN